MRLFNILMLSLAASCAIARWLLRGLRQRRRRHELSCCPIGRGATAASPSSAAAGWEEPSLLPAPLWQPEITTHTAITAMGCTATESQLNLGVKSLEGRATFSGFPESSKAVLIPE
jgi:hypothetical protein